MKKLALILSVWCLLSPALADDDDSFLAMMFKDNFARSNSPDIRFGWVEDEEDDYDALIWNEEANFTNRLDDQILSITNKLNHSRGFNAQNMWAQADYFLKSAYDHRGRPLGKNGYADLILSETEDFSDRWIKMRITMKGILELEYLNGSTHLQFSKEIYSDWEQDLWETPHHVRIETHPLGYAALLWRQGSPRPIVPMLLETPDHLSPIRIRYVMDDGSDQGIFGMESLLDNVEVMSNLVVLGEQDESHFLSSQGQKKNGRYGEVMTVLDDLNQDGWADYIVGAPYAGNRDQGEIWVHSGQDGRLLYKIQGKEDHARFGSAVAALSDLDSDGFGDFAVSTTRADNGNGSYGRVDLFSGLQGNFISSLYSGQSSRDFGISLATLPDMNQDGHQELAIADSVLQEVIVFSAIDGQVISRIDGNLLSDQGRFGDSMAAIEDLNQDQLPDLIIGAPFEDHDFTGVVFAISAIDGQLIHRTPGPNESYLGNQVGVLGDLNNDGFEDYYGSSSLVDRDENFVEIISGQDGSILFSLSSILENELGSSLCAAGDVDQDGCDDFLIGIPGSDHDRGKVHLCSGANARVLQIFDGEAQDDRFGQFLKPYPDYDGNGDTEFLVSAPFAKNKQGRPVGKVNMYSFQKPLLAPTVSVDTFAAFTVISTRDTNRLADIISYLLLVDGRNLSAWLTDCLLTDPQHCQAVIHEDGKGVDVYIDGDWRSKVVSFSVCDQDGLCASDDNQ